MKKSKSKNNFGVKLGKKIGVGSKGDVYFVDYMSGDKKYIVKIIQNSKSIKNEINNQIIASKKGIAPKILTYTDEYIVMEYIDGYTLHDYILKYGFDSISDKVYEAIDLLHSQNIIHNDLSDTNILVSKTGKVYIIDFGSSKYSKNFTDDDFMDDDILFMSEY